MFRAVRDAIAAFRRQGKEFEVIRKQRMAMEEQLETFRATSAAQMKTSEQQTLDMLRGLVEKMEKSRGEMKIDQQAVREQVNNIETALEGQLSQKMRETMDKLMDLASEAPASGTREPRDLDRER